MVMFLVTPGVASWPPVSLSPPGASSNVSYYLSLGDSLAQGYQPGFSDQSETLAGFSNDVVRNLAAQRHLVLENFGCGGETSGAMLSVPRCAPQDRSLNSALVTGETPVTAALKFIARHQGHIGLITIVIGANDVLAHTPLSQTVSNIERIAALVRGAVGTKVPMIGLGYDDPALGLWLKGPSDLTTVVASVHLIKNVTDPALARAYASSGVTFVDIAKDFQTFEPFTKTMWMAPYGTIPVAVARICTFTWECKMNNVHPTTAGYAAMATAITSAYLQITGAPASRVLSAQRHGV